MRCEQLIQLYVNNVYLYKYNRHLQLYNSVRLNATKTELRNVTIQIYQKKIDKFHRYSVLRLRESYQQAIKA